MSRPAILVALAAIASLMAAPVDACSIATSTEMYAPDLKRFEWKPGPGQKGMPGPYWEPLPAPIAAVKSLRRGWTGDGESCGDAGLLTINVSLPPTSAYRIDEFGVYVRLRDGVTPDRIFPSVPLSAPADGGTMPLTFVWLDGGPPHEPLKLQVEVFLVARDLSIGPATMLVIDEQAAGSPHRSD